MGIATLVTTLSRGGRIKSIPSWHQRSWEEGFSPAMSTTSLAFQFSQESVEDSSAGDGYMWSLSTWGASTLLLFCALLGLSCFCLRRGHLKEVGLPMGGSRWSPPATGYGRTYRAMDDGL